jgi:hypothetical protein
VPDQNRSSSAKFVVILQLFAYRESLSTIRKTLRIPFRSAGEVAAVGLSPPMQRSGSSLTVPSIQGSGSSCATTYHAYTPSSSAIDSTPAHRRPHEEPSNPSTRASKRSRLSTSTDHDGQIAGTAYDEDKRYDPEPMETITDSNIDPDLRGPPQFSPQDPYGGLDFGSP